MPTIIPIKASRIANLTDARYFAAAEAGWLGVNFDPASGPAVSMEEIAAFWDWVAGPAWTAEFGLLEEQEYLKILEHLNFKWLQFRWHEGFKLPDIEGKKIILEILQREGSDIEPILEKHQDKVQFFLINMHQLTDPIGTLAHSPIGKLTNSYKLFLDLPLTPENLDQVLEKDPAGIQLRGGDELQVGLKAFDDLNEILDRLYSEDEA